MAQYANPNQFGAPMGDNDGGYMEQVRALGESLETN